MTETILDLGVLRITEEAISFISASDENGVEGRVSLSAIASVTKKGILLPFVWPVLATISAELFVLFAVLSVLNPLTRQPLADSLINILNWCGFDATVIVQRFYDDHHLFLISMIFLVLTLLPVAIAVLVRRGRLAVRLVSAHKPAVGELILTAGKDVELLQEAMTKVVEARRSRGGG